MTEITNFLRYPGSKRRMLGFLIQHLTPIQVIKGTYFEPFLGSGAVYFLLNPAKAHLSDINPDLIDLFRGIKKAPSEVWKSYCDFGNSKQDYEAIRRTRQRPTLQDKAARVLYLNRTCFKGMWRTNKRGMFNVGYGGQDRRWAITQENLLNVSDALRRSRITCNDFEETISLAHCGDFIFCDPPYKPGSKHETNNHYSGIDFTFDDQERLAKLLRRATRKGISWAMTNSSHREILKLYSASNSYKLNFPSGTGNKPGVLVKNPGEVLITNYRIVGGKEIL